jgi:predicted DNA-binding transcriptional regulator AlpA
MSKDYNVFERLLNDRQVAELMSVSVATVRRWRLHGAGPRYFKIGALVRYCPEEVRTWLKARPAGGESDFADTNINC